MAKFKCGDRVRINCAESIYNGLEATIWATDVWQMEDLEAYGPELVGVVGDVCYLVDIDGLGRSDDVADFAYDHYELIPMVSPDELAWQQFKTFLQPNPSILPPIVTTSDEEAARIAETTPGSHIHVVSRSGNVLSEYWGKPW